MKAKLSAVILCVGVILSIVGLKLSFTKYEVSDNIILTATYLPPSKNRPSVTFQVSANSHTIDLSNKTFIQGTYIQIDGGPRIQARAWKLINGGHHMSGQLYFSERLPESTKELRLIINGFQPENNKGNEWVFQESELFGNTSLQ